MTKRSALPLSFILSLVAPSARAQVLMEIPAPSETLSVPVAVPEGLPGLPAASEPPGKPGAEDAPLSRSPLDGLEKTGEALSRPESAGGSERQKPEALNRLFDAGKSRASAGVPAESAGQLGIDVSAMDRSVRPQDDFFRHVNGTWLKSSPIPADKTSFGVFDDLEENSEKAVKAIVEDAAAKSAAPESPDQKMADLYRSFMDEKAVEAKGLAPLASELARIDKLTSAAQLPAAFARAGRSGIGVPVRLSVEWDSKNPNAYIATLRQGGLGLPDRGYYLDEGERSDMIRTKYVEYLTTIFALSGESDAAAKAKTVFDLETAMAKRQWTKTDNRNPDKTYNKTPVTALEPVFAAFLSANKVPASELSAIVAQPSYLAGLSQVLAETPLSTWKLYLKARTLDSSAAYLPAAFVNAAFEFRGRGLSGQPEMRPRWKRAVGLVDGALGELVGQEYVRRHFPESSKRKMKAMIENLQAAFAERIKSRPWMSEDTKKKALEKLAKFTAKIGYPDKWRDYSKLKIKAGDLLGNVRRSNRFDFDEMLAKLGKPVDRGEWQMTPQTVNAYYDPVMNEIAFPAGIIQGAFFNPEADDAANYGAIGAVIGHEMSHGFDDEGSKFDGDGVLMDWWTAADRAEFDKRAESLAAQFSGYEPLPGKHIDGHLTLGENIGDLGGIMVAYEAYQRSLGGKPAPVIEGFSGAQRFFMGFAQVWRFAIREQALAMQLSIDYHAPAEYRVNGSLPNVPGFYEAFGVQEGDKLFFPETKRIKIW